MRSGDAEGLTSYASIAADPDIRLGVVSGQVHVDTAIEAGVPERRLRYFSTQDDAVRTVLACEVDAVASTAIGSRALVARLADTRLVALDAVPQTRAAGCTVASPLGAFALHHDDGDRARAVDAALGAFLGSGAHRDLMARYGFNQAELDALPRID